MHDDQLTLLAIIVAASEKTQEEIVDGFVRCAQEHQEDAALSLRTLRRWMVGDVQTQPRPAQRRVARIYWGHPMHELLAPPIRETTVPQLFEPVVVPDRVDAPLGTMNLERQITMSARRAARFTTYAETHTVGTEAIEQLRHDVVGLANAYVREPLTTIMGDLIELQDAAFGFLEGQQKPAQTRDLYVLASVITGMVAKASQDLGRFHDAMTLARTMYVCADNADHLGLRAWARNLQSLIAYWAGRPQEAARYAQSGSEIAAPLSGSITTWLASSEARAWAQLGAADEARAALARAAGHREHLQADDLDEVGGLFAFPLAKQHYYAAGTYVYLDGLYADAASEATQALELYESADAESRAFADEAGTRAELALARIHEGHLDGARDALDPVLDYGPELRIGGIVASVGRVHAALSDRRYKDSTIARGLRDEIESFSQRPAAALTA
jgi:tetratricopeptide (TPR) repeat protein